MNKEGSATFKAHTFIEIPNHLKPDTVVFDWFKVENASLFLSELVRSFKENKSALFVDRDFDNEESTLTYASYPPEALYTFSLKKL